MARVRQAGSRCNNSAMFSSSQLKKGASLITPYLMISASPARNSRAGSVAKASASLSTATG